MNRLKNFKPKHFEFELQGKVAVIRLSRPERKNPLTFESYAEMRDMFRDAVYADHIKAFVFASNEGNFCSGGDVHDIIAPLVKMEMPDLLNFTRMTGDLVKAMIHAPQPIIAAVEGIAVGAGAGTVHTLSKHFEQATQDCAQVCLDMPSNGRSVISPSAGNLVQENVNQGCKAVFGNVHGFNGLHRQQIGQHINGKARIAVVAYKRCGQPDRYFAPAHEFGSDGGQADDLGPNLIPGCCAVDGEHVDDETRQETIAQVLDSRQVVAIL